MMLALLLTAVSARFGPGFVTTTTTQDPNTPTCTVAELFTGLDETTHNPQFCPAYNKNCRNMYEPPAAGGTPCHYDCTKYLDMHWCYTEDCTLNPSQPCAWGWCMMNADQSCPLQAPPIPEDETCPFICSAYGGVPGMEEQCGGPDVISVTAECAEVFLPAVRMTDDERPYIVNPQRRKGQGREAGAAWFNFKCCEDVAKFEVEMEVITIGGGANSFWLFVDDVRQQFGWRIFDPDWQWAKPPMDWEVQAGCHNFIVDDREPGTKFRSVRMIGEAAEKCHFSAHTADHFEAEAAVADTRALAFKAGQVVQKRSFGPEDLTVEDGAVYLFAAVGGAALLYGLFRAIHTRSVKYAPINDVEHAQYSA